MGVQGECLRVHLADIAPSLQEAPTGSGLRLQAFALAFKPLESRLARAIEMEIGPRLALVHHECEVAPPSRRPTATEIENLAHLSIGKDESALLAFFELVKAQHQALGTLLAFFIAPAALYLGELWKQDLCDFFDVTVGVGRLQLLMNRLESPIAASGKGGDRQALLIAPLGETHVLGLRMVGKLLDAVGWDVTFEEQRSLQQSARTAADKWFAVVGVTVALASGLEQAARTIAVVRDASKNRNLAVVVGGNAFTDHPELIAQVGADAGGFDAPSAVVLASHLLARQPLAR
jgi:MerR family transcriptional regulator, light-induced transcriptional regulator